MNNRRKIGYFEVENEIMDRFYELRPQKQFLQEVIEILDMEFDGVKYADKIIDYLIENEQ